MVHSRSQSSSPLANRPAQLLRFSCVLPETSSVQITANFSYRHKKIPTHQSFDTWYQLLLSSWQPRSQGLSSSRPLERGRVVGRIELHVTLFVFNSQQQRTFSPGEAAPFVGVFHTDDVPTIREISINYRDGKLQFSVGEYHFHLNHIARLTFELIDRREVKCLRIVVMGINHEKVHFDPFGAPPGRNRTSGFTVFGFNLQGKAYFYRKKNMLS